MKASRGDGDENLDGEDQKNSERSIATTLKHQGLVIQLLLRGAKESVAEESYTDATYVVQRRRGEGPARFFLFWGHSMSLEKADQQLNIDCQGSLYTYTKIWFI